MKHLHAVLPHEGTGRPVRPLRSASVRAVPPGVIIVLLLLVVLVPAAAVSAAPPPPPIATTTINQNVRAMGHLGAPILEVLPPGVTVTLHVRLPDNSWVDVTTPKGTRGWMYCPYLKVDDQAVAALPTVGQDYLVPMDQMMQMMPASDGAAPTLAPTTTTPAPDGMFRPETTAAAVSSASQNAADMLATLPVATIAELPSDQTAAQQPAGQSIPITLAVCVDVNQNRACDLGEGIRDVPILVRDTTTEQVLAAKATGADGLLRVTVDVPQGDQLALEAPTFGWSESVPLYGVQSGNGQTPRPPQLQPLIAPQPVALPWPLP